MSNATTAERPKRDLTIRTPDSHLTLGCTIKGKAPLAYSEASDCPRRGSVLRTLRADQRFNQYQILPSTRLRFRLAGAGFLCLI